MRTDPSVHPCLDTFDILMTTPNITEDKYIRLIRVYTSNHVQRYYANTLKLDYVREYKLPANNYLRLDCHLFDANFRYYCFAFVALSRTTGAVVVNSRPHCRPTTRQMIVTSSTDSPLEDNVINPLRTDIKFADRLRPAGSSYRFSSQPTKTTVSNIYGKSRRISDDSRSANDVHNLINKYEDNYFDSDDIEANAHYINIDCKCSEDFVIASNASSLVISLAIIVCNRKNSQNKDNKQLDSSDRVVSSDETIGAFDANKSVFTPNESHSSERNYLKNTLKNKRYPSDARDGRDVEGLTSDDGISGDFSDGNSHGIFGADSHSNYWGSEVVSTICVLNLMESQYKMRVQYENWRNVPLIYVDSSSAHSPRLVVREGRLAIDPQLDINNKSQIHSLRSQYLRIESFYAQNLTLKLILLNTNNHIVSEKYSTFRVLLSSLTPIHYTSLALIALFLLCLLALILISLLSTQRKTTVKIVTPSEEGDQTRTSYMEPTDVMSQFSLPDDNQSLEMDYYDYLLPFVPRPQSATSDAQ